MWWDATPDSAAEQASPLVVVGPCIGSVGCLHIELGRAVCGTAAASRKTIIVPDGNAFPGQSEIVVPVFAPDGVLDVDSDQLDAFDDEDQRGLEKIVALFGQT